MNLVKESKYLSLILRHKPEAAGITLDEHGWADVDALIAGIQKSRRFDRKMLEEIVRTDDKQRYSFNEHKTRIRANQGHYVHLSGDPETARKVGQRHGTPVIYMVDSQRMAADGFLFYRSVNGVWLTKCVPAKYLKKQNSES